MTLQRCALCRIAELHNTHGHMTINLSNHVRYSGNKIPALIAYVVVVRELHLQLLRFFLLNLKPKRKYSFDILQCNCSISERYFQALRTSNVKVR